MQSGILIVNVFNWNSSLAFLWLCDIDVFEEYKEVILQNIMSFFLISDTETYNVCQSITKNLGLFKHSFMVLPGFPTV
jgi:hypothetical protein